MDPALRDRPSRFDRTWHFELPEQPERTRYLVTWATRLDEATRIDNAACERVAAMTGGFSFAYLKELIVSALMRWIDEREHQTSLALAAVVERNIASLREQMRESALPPSAAEPTAHEDDEDL